jgi:hypothetical protein
MCSNGSWESLSFSGPCRYNFSIRSSHIYPSTPSRVPSRNAYLPFLAMHSLTPSTPRVQTRTLACMTLCETWHIAQCVSIPPALSHTFDRFVRLAIALHISISHSTHAGGINVMSEVQSHVRSRGS